tara:strand:- start:2366 stop:3049 length:684 start_codon:yes stop_codon:yes gene_type:complete
MSTPTKVDEMFAEMELLNIANDNVMHRCELGEASPGEMEACRERVLAINKLMEDVVNELRAYKAWDETEVSQWIHQDYNEKTFKGWPGRKLAAALENKNQSNATFLLLQLKEKQGPVHMAALEIFKSSQPDQAPEPEQVPSSEPEQGLWTCTNCTLHNSENVCICDVCGMTRASHNDVAEEPEQGLWTCTFCTLHNSKNVHICDVCGTTRDSHNDVAEAAKYLSTQQ